jgi:hypothetical protein
VGLGHVGTLDDDDVGVDQVLLEAGRAATAERGPQTGDGRAVSDAGLVLDLDRAQRGPQLLDEVVLLVVQGGAAEAAIPVVRRNGLPSGSASCQESRRAAITRSAIMSIAWSSASSSHWVPWGRRYLTVSSRAGPLTSCRVAAPLGHSLPREIGESGSPSTWMTCASLT